MASSSQPAVDAQILRKVRASLIRLGGGRPPPQLSSVRKAEEAAWHALYGKVPSNLGHSSADDDDDSELEA